MATDVPSILAEHAKTTGDAFDALMRGQAGAPPRLVEAIRYSFEAGGKRLRPALVLETHRAIVAAAATAAAADADASDAARAAATTAAVAIELVHTFSLVHDDLPAMDDDDLRRGRPTNHKVFGEAMAILAGDAMVAMAFEVLAECRPPGRAVRLVAELARAAGPAGMIGGQVLDMAGEGQSLSYEQLQSVHRKKTGALLTAACRLGATAAGATDAALAAVTAYGGHLGLAFQITDDVLDETATAEQLGKATNKDAVRGKNTYPRLLGLDGARRAAAEQIDSAVAALSPLGDAADRLVAVARFVGGRRA